MIDSDKIKRPCPKCGKSWDFSVNVRTGEATWFLFHRPDCVVLEPPK